ncbi:RG [Linum grandiflorum]
MMMFVILKQLLLLLLLMVAASSELGILADDENDMGAPITTDPCLDSDYIEGAHDFANGKGPSVWDRFTHEFPAGRRSDGVNQRGINFYHRLLDLLIENGNIRIEPFVTIWHWDTPQGLEAEYGGFLSRDIVADIAAAKRALDWMYGWYMDPITNGRYPYTMEMLLGSRLPKFTDDESRLLKSSYDFLGLNYYTGYFVKYNEDFDPVNLRYATDSHGITSPDRDGKYIGPHVCMSKKDNSSKTLAEALKDEGRINFYNLHLANVLRAMKEEQVKVKGFFTWSYADNFEWNEGYTVRFGLYYINYTDRSRHPKDTACWYTNFCKKTQPKSLKHFDFDHHKLINTTPATSLAAL